jgi:hypothetical protein
MGFYGNIMEIGGNWDCLWDFVRICYMILWDFLWDLMGFVYHISAVPWFKLDVLAAFGGLGLTVA